MDLFSELDRAPEYVAKPKQKRMSRAQREAIEKRQREQRWMLEDAKANGVFVDDVEQLRCAAPCPTVLGWPYETDDLCAGCLLALARAGIVVCAPGTTQPSPGASDPRAA
jgi:hypothetical protein